MGVTNTQWDKAMSLMGNLLFSPIEQASGWPDSMTPRQIAGLQRPWSINISTAEKFSRLLQERMERACKSGDLPHTATTVSRLVSGERTVDTLQKSELFGAHARVVYTVPAQYKDVTTYTVTAQAFAAWLAAQPEELSEHIKAWFEAVGVNTQPKTEPVANGAAIASTEPTKNKRRDDLWAIIEGIQKVVSDPFDTAAIWLRLCEVAQAEEKQFPLMGMAGKNIQWRIDKMDEPKEFTRKMLSDRLGKQKRVPTKKEKPPLKRVK